MKEKQTMRKMILIFAVCIAVAVFGCNRSGPKGAGTGKKLTIAVIPKGTSHEFWKSIHAGSIKAARELSTQGSQVEVIWKGPLREDDREQQIQSSRALLRRALTASCWRRSTTARWLV